MTILDVATLEMKEDHNHPLTIHSKIIGGKIVNENSSSKKLKPTFKFCVRISRSGNSKTRFHRLLLDSDFYLNPLA